MVEHLRQLSVVEPEVIVHSADEADGSEEQDHERPVAVTLGVERIVTDFVAEWFIVGVWFIDDQVGMRVR